jgi:hypothetical protein
VKTGADEAAAGGLDDLAAAQSYLFGFELRHRRPLCKPSAHYPRKRAVDLSSAF